MRLEVPHVQQVLQEAMLQPCLPGGALEKFNCVVDPELIEIDGITLSKRGSEAVAEGEARGRRELHGAEAMAVEMAVGVHDF